MTGPETGAPGRAPRDAGAASLAVLLLLLSAGVVGLPAPGFLPTTPEAFGAAAALVTAVWCGVVVPSLRHVNAGSVVASVAVSVPFLVLAEASAVAPLVWQMPVLAFAAVLGVVSAALAPRLRHRLTTGVAGALVLGPLVASFGLVAIPETLLLPRAPLASGDVATEGRPARLDERIPVAWRTGTRDDGRRVGALARRPEALAGVAEEHRSIDIDAPFLPVPEGTPGALGRAGLVLRVLGPRPPVDRMGSFAILSGRALPPSPLDLDAVDVLQLPAGLDLDAREADLLVGFVRRGGLLAGPPPPAQLPATLRRRLGGAVPDQAGPAGARVAGLGHVALAADAAALEALATARLAIPRLSTAFDRAIAPPRGLLALALPTDEPSSRRSALAILLPFVGAVLVLAGVGGRGRAARLGFVSVAAAVAVFGMTHRAPSAVGQPIRLEVGGAGGRRIEGLVVTAGPAGLLLAGASSADGGIRALGFEARVVGGRLRLVLPAHGRGVLVEEGEVGGRDESLPATADLPGWAQPFIDRGDAPPGAFQLYAGVAPYRGPRPVGVRVVGEARCLAVVPGRP